MKIDEIDLKVINIKGEVRFENCKGAQSEQTDGEVEN